MNRDLLTRNLLVFTGAGLGGLARHAAGVLATALVPASFPWGTFTVNVTGCFAMGALMYLFSGRVGGTSGRRLFFMVGFLGGYTTFSALAYETYALMSQGRPMLGLLYVVSSAAFGLVAVRSGRASVRRLERRVPSPPPRPAASLTEERHP